MPKSRGGGGDSGVSSRMEGAFLTAMNDIQEQVFWVFTANDVKNMHEAFFRAERVDASFYVRLPDAVQRSAVWRLYGAKFFPKEVTLKKQTVVYPDYRSTSFEEVFDAFKKVKASKPADVVAWAEKFVLPLMCLAPGHGRELALESLRKQNDTVAQAVRLVEDEGWSPAEIRACCRLARRLKESLLKTQRRICPVAISASAAIEYLEEWATGYALDAETGELYQPAGEKTEDGAPKQKEFGKTRRRVRQLSNPEDPA